MHTERTHTATAQLLRFFTTREQDLRDIALRLRTGFHISPEEAYLVAAFLEFHAHYPAATLMALEERTTI